MSYHSIFYSFLEDQQVLGSNLYYNNLYHRLPKDSLSLTCSWNKREEEKVVLKEDYFLLLPQRTITKLFQLQTLKAYH